MALSKLDTIQMDNLDLPPELKKWVSNTIDIINQAFDDIDAMTTAIDARLTAGGL